MSAAHRFQNVELEWCRISVLLDQAETRAIASLEVHDYYVRDGITPDLIYDLTRIGEESREPDRARGGR